MAGRIIFVLLLAMELSAQQPPVSLASARTFHISGKVVNAVTGQPVANTEVSIGVSTEPEALQKERTGQDGRFGFSGVAPGKYWLAAQRKGFSVQRYEEHYGFFTGVVTGPGLDSENLVFRLNPDASISGVITDEQAEPIQATVLLFRKGTEDGGVATLQWSQEMTDERGHYRFSHLPRGQYFVAVSAQPWYTQGVRRDSVSAEQIPLFDVAYPLTYYPGATDEAAAKPIILSAGDHVAADLTLTIAPALHVRMKRGNSGPFVQVSHRVFGALVGTSWNAAEAEGEFEIYSAPAGQYALDVESLGERPTEHSEIVKLTGDTEIDMAATPSSTSIRGVVKLEQGVSLPPNAAIRLWNRVSGEVLDAPLSATGEFQFNPRFVTPGSYAISLPNVMTVVLSSVSATGAKPTGRSVRITGSGSVQLTLTLSNGINIDGIAMRDGKAVAGAMVVLVPRDPEHNLALFRRDQSDSDGTFTLRSTLPGTYTVVAIQNGWDLEWANPVALEPYMAKGEVLRVDANRTYQITVPVQ